MKNRTRVADTINVSARRGKSEIGLQFSENQLSYESRKSHRSLRTCSALSVRSRTEKFRSFKNNKENEEQQEEERKTLIHKISKYASRLEITSVPRRSTALPYV
jgi:hypothetical protein